MNNECDPSHIPLHLLDKAREISNYMEEQGFVNWELGTICSRNFADKVRVYEDFFEFVKEEKAKRQLTFE